MECRDATEQSGLVNSASKALITPPTPVFSKNGNKTNKIETKSTETQLNHNPN